jgi:peroxiredoxin
MVYRSLVILVFYLCTAVQAGEIDKQSWHDLRLNRLNQPAPDFSVGKNKLLSGYQGQWVILHFWATWCKPCSSELPKLNDLFMRWRDHNVAFLTVSIDTENKERVSTFTQKLGLRLPVLLGDDIDVTDRYWSWGLPVTYIINPDGIIVARALGPREWNSDAGDELLASLSGSAPLQDSQNLGLRDDGLMLP